MNYPQMTFTESSDEEKKFNNSLVTRDTSIILKKNFRLPHLGRYLFKEVNGNRDIPRGSNGNVLVITATDKVFVTRWVISLVIITFVFVLIHSIHLKSSKENSIVLYLFTNWCFAMFLRWTFSTEIVEPEFEIKDIDLHYSSSIAVPERVNFRSLCKQGLKHVQFAQVDDGNFWIILSFSCFQFEKINHLKEWIMTLDTRCNNFNDNVENIDALSSNRQYQDDIASLTPCRKFSHFNLFRGRQKVLTYSVQCFRSTW